MMMDPSKELLLGVIEARSLREMQELSVALARSTAEEKEAILAGIEFEQWLADACADCQNGR
jgi:hypothetical protein